MKDRILNDPAFSLGLFVWAVTATVFPLQLGLAGAAVLSLAAYLVVAGFLLAAADALLNPRLYRRLDDVFSQSLFWMIGLSIPAAIMFAIGMAAAPARQDFRSDLCRLGGLEGRLADADDRTDSVLEDALEALEDC